MSSKSQLAVRVLARAIKGLLVAIYFVVALGLGSVLHLGLPISRTATARILEQTLNTVLKGSFEIGSVSQFFGGSIALEDVEIYDPNGRLVISLEHLDASVDPIDILRRTLSPLQNLSIEIKQVRADGLKLHLLATTQRDPTGKLLAHPSVKDTFTPVKSGTNTTSSGARPLRIWMPKILLRDAAVGGSILDSPVMQSQIERAVAQLLVTEKGVLLDVNRFGLRTSGLLGVDTEARGEVHLRVPGAIYGQVSGAVGEIPAEVDFHFASAKVELTAHFPRLQPVQVRPVLGSWPLDESVSLTVKATGALPLLNIEARAAALTQRHTEAFFVSGTGILDVTGPQANLYIKAHDLDLSRLVHQLPSSKLNAEGDLNLQLGSESAPKLDATIRLQSGVIANHVLPPATLDGKYEAGKLSAVIAVAEPNLKFTATLSTQQNGTIEFQSNIQGVSSKSPYLRPYLGKPDGTIRGTASGQILEGCKIEGTLDVQLESLRVAELSVEKVNLRSDFRGTYTEPLKIQATTHASASQLNYGALNAKTITVKQTGAILEPQLDVTATLANELKLAVSGRAQLEQQSMTQVTASAQGEGEPLSLVAERIVFKNQRLQAKQFSIKSRGEITGDLDLSPNGGAIDVVARSLDLSRISRHLGLAPGDLEGILDGEVDLDLTDHPSGWLKLSLNHAAYRGFIDVNANVDAEVRDKNVTGSLTAHVPGFVEITSKLDAQITGSLMKLRSLQTATGQLTTELNHIDLKTLTLLLGMSKTADLSGEANIKLEMQRDADLIPQFSLSLHTTDLGVTLPSKNAEAITIQGIDLESITTASLEGSRADSALRLKDAHGELVSVAGHIQLPLHDWWRDVPTQSQIKNVIKDAPVNFVAVIPERKLKYFPSILRLPLSSGRMNARLALNGSFSSPEIGIMVDGKDVMTGPAGGVIRPLDVNGNVRYSADDGALVGQLLVENQDQSLGSMSAEINLPWQNVISPPAQDSPMWTGNVQLYLESLPLSLLQVAVDHKVFGRAEGTLSLSRTALLPEVNGKLRIRHLVAAGHDIGDASFALNSTGNDVQMIAELSDTFGDLEAIAELSVAALDDGFGLSPSKPILVGVRANKYNAAALGPILQGAIDEVSGPMEGELQLQLFPPNREQPAQARISGEMKLLDGTIRPSAVGISLVNTKLTMRANYEDGRNILTVSDIEANVGSSVPNLHGRAVMRLQNFTPETGEFDLRANAVPLYQGATLLATVSGATSGKLTTDERGILLSVLIHKVLAELAEGVDDQLIDVSENPNIKVVQAPRETKKEKSNLSTPLLITVDLGDDARIKNSLLDARVAGQPQIVLANDTQIAGSIEVRRGSRFVVLGRSFIVDRGLLQFDTGDAADPHLQIGANWAAPNNVLVRLDVGGTLSAPTLTWSSEPSLPGGEDAVLSLVIGGGGGGASGSTSLAIVANELSNVEGLEFYSTQQTAAGDGRVASLNDTSWESYTASYQINDKLWFEGSYERQTMTADQGVKSGVSGTLDWRFLPQWSVRTEVGTMGMGLDLMWQYRY